MTIIKRSAIVGYSTCQMFELVNAIEDYPRFLPWCRASHILHRDEKEVEAQLDITWSGFHKSFTTRNRLFPHERIEITLVQGPMRRLEGTWHFYPSVGPGSTVELDLDFEFTGSLVDRMFQPIFHHIANSLVDLFCKRAVEIYGSHP